MAQSDLFNYQYKDCYFGNNNTHTKLLDTDKFHKLEGKSLKQCIDFASKNISPYMIQTDYNEDTEKSNCFIPKIYDISNNNIYDNYGLLSQSIDLIKFSNENFLDNARSIFSEKSDKCIRKEDGNIYANKDINNLYTLYNIDNYNELEESIENMNNLVSPENIDIEMKHIYSNIFEKILNLKTDIDKYCNDEIQDKEASVRNINTKFNQIQSDINSYKEYSNTIITNFEILKQVKKYKTTHINKLDKATKNNKFLLKNYLSLDNANNGKLNDTRFNKNIKLADNLVLISIILIFSIIYVKKYN
jgi:hypothetical protein|tara:strand:- start:223 stop:1131 length:909 start_codon:yes stop_codon:yes gene_type:complete